MKLKHILIGSTIALTALCSCADFLDVRPKQELVEGELFKSASGFEDAIYGVYGSLQTTALYGKNLTWFMNEILAQNYGSYLNNDVTPIARYDYENARVVTPLLSEIWTQAYTAIGYVNNILAQLEKWNPEEMQYHDLYKGEMLGVRAFLHFDLLRLFTAVNDMSANGIPYTETYSYKVTPFSSVGKVYEYILRDLLEAEKLLKQDEELLVYPREDQSRKAFVKTRETHFNLYAAQATLARVYWMKGDLKQAGIYARKVIDSEKFPLVDRTEVQDFLTGILSEKETIWGVYSTAWQDNTQKYLYNNTSNFSLSPYGTESGSTYPDTYQNVYAKDNDNSGTDFRMNHFRTPSKVGDIRHMKLVDYMKIENLSDRADAIRGFSLLRTAEMYLIAAEALLEENPTEARKYFDLQIASRGLNTFENRNLPLTLENINNEYRKEFFGEGLEWYNMKRQNRDILSNEEKTTLTASPKLYVLPIPVEEYDYRNE